MKRVNPRRVKIHRNYTVDEVARLFGIHENTVRSWIKSGLKTIDDRRPTLILGRDLAAFLHNRRQTHRQRCLPGQLYCMRCRAPRAPARGVADYVPITSNSGNLRAVCNVCGSRMFRRAAREKIYTVAKNIEVAIPQE